MVVRPDSSSTTTGEPSAEKADRRDETSGLMGRPRGPVMHVATRSMSVDDFVVRFSGLASDEALVLPAMRELPIGTEARFAVHLQDRTVVMRGRCRVTECRLGSPPSGETTNPGARRFMVRVALLEMDDESRAVHQRMLSLKAAPVPGLERSGVPLPVFGGDTEQNLGAPASFDAARPRVPTPRLGSRSGRPGPPPLPGFLSASARGGEQIATPRVPATSPARPSGDSQVEDLSSLAEESDPSGATTTVSPQPVSSDASRAEAIEDRTEAKTVSAPPNVTGDDDAPADDDLAAPPRRRFPKVIAIGALCAGIGIAAGFILRPAPARSPSRPASAPTAATTPPMNPAAPPPAAPAPATPEPPAPAEVAAPARPGSPAATPAAPVEKLPSADTTRPAAVPPAGSCAAQITTEPADAKVFWGDQLLGRSPIESVSVPCGPSRVTLERERYQIIARDVTVEPGTPFVVTEKLTRPPAVVSIESSPPGAAIVINGRAHGVTPARLDLFRYERISIKLTLPGHAAFEQAIYLKAPETKIAPQLVPAAAP